MNRFFQLKKLPWLVAAILGIASCQPASNNPNIPEDTEGWVPVYSTDKDAHSVASVSPQKTEAGGKIYVKGNLMYQVEPGKGIHVIDISHHDNPQKIQFIAVTGAQEIAIKENYLYTNNLNDLVVVDISNLSDVKLINRMPAVFHVINQNLPPESGYFECVESSKGVVVGWEKKNIHRPKCIKN